MRRFYFQRSLIALVVVAALVAPQAALARPKPEPQLCSALAPASFLFLAWEWLGSPRVNEKAPLRPSGMKEGASGDPNGGKTGAMGSPSGQPQAGSTSLPGARCIFDPLVDCSPL